MRVDPSGGRRGELETEQDPPIPRPRRTAPGPARMRPRGPGCLRAGQAQSPAPSRQAARREGAPSTPADGARAPRTPLPPRRPVGRRAVSSGAVAKGPTAPTLCRDLDPARESISATAQASPPGDGPCARPYRPRGLYPGPQPQGGPAPPRCHARRTGAARADSAPATETSTGGAAACAPGTGSRPAAPRKGSAGLRRRAGEPAPTPAQAPPTSASEHARSHGA